MTTTEISLTALESAALNALRNNVESTDGRIGGPTWGCVYLDNAKPANWSGKTWSAVLASLSSKSLYQRHDSFFGYVLLLEEEEGEEAQWEAAEDSNAWEKELDLIKKPCLTFIKP